MGFVSVQDVVDMCFTHTLCCGTMQIMSYVWDTLLQDFRQLLSLYSPCISFFGFKHKPNKQFRFRGNIRVDKLPEPDLLLNLRFFLDEGHILS